MKNTETCKIIGMKNGIACLILKNGQEAWTENAEHIGEIGDTVEVLEKDIVYAGDLAEDQKMWDKCHA